MAKMLVQNNCGGMVTLQLPGPARQPGSTDTTVHLGPLSDLGPGMNTVDKGVWEQAKKNPTVQLLLKERVPPSAAPEQDQRLVGRFKLVEVKEVADENPLAKMKTPEAKMLVEETLNVDTLGEWLQGEKRDELRKVIQKQIAEINAPMLGKGGALPPTAELEDNS